MRYLAPISLLLLVFTIGFAQRPKDAPQPKDAKQAAPKTVTWDAFPPKGFPRARRVAPRNDAGLQQLNKAQQPSLKSLIGTRLFGNAQILKITPLDNGQFRFLAVQYNSKEHYAVRTTSAEGWPASVRRNVVWNDSRDVARASSEGDTVKIDADIVSVSAEYLNLFAGGFGPDALFTIEVKPTK